MTWTNEKHEILCEQLDRLEQQVHLKNLKRYKLHLLKGISRRMPEMTAICQTCNDLMQQVEIKMQEVENLDTNLDLKDLRVMKPLMQELLRHLDKEHKIVEPDQYIGMYMPMGIGIGMAMGAAMQNVGVGLSLGIAIGLAIGSSIDSKAKKEDRVI